MERATKNTEEKYASYPVTLDSAINATTRWREWMENNSVPGDVQTNAFFIPMGDLLSLISQKEGLLGIRAYVAMAEEADPEGASSLKLLLVAVDPSPEPVSPDYGVDIIEEISGSPGLVTVYDFTSPCPKFCDSTSPLLTGA